MEAVDILFDHRNPVVREIPGQLELHARIVDGNLTATSPELWVKMIGFGFMWPELLPLHQAKLKARVVSGGASGVVLAEGVLSGVALKDDLNTMVANMQATCDAAPAGAKPDFCSYLTVATSAMALLFDLHQVIDDQGKLTFVAKSKENPGDAASVCLTYDLSKAKVIGFEPVTP